MDLFPSTFFVQPLASQDASGDDTFALIASALKSLLATADSVVEKIEGRVRLPAMPCATYAALAPLNPFCPSPFTPKRLLRSAPAWAR